MLKNNNSIFLNFIITNFFTDTVLCIYSIKSKEKGFKSSDLKILTNLF